MRDLGPKELRGSSEFHIWQSMIARCRNPNANGYENYGGRGIKVCNRWADSFGAFYQDMGPRPGPEYSVERNNSNGDYKPSNCRWATITEQNRNRSSNRLVKYKGKMITLAELSEITGVGRMTITHRLEAGQSVEEAVRQPFTRYEYNGRNLTLREWAAHLDVKYSTLYKRVVLKHWPLAKALVRD